VVGEWRQRHTLGAQKGVPPHITVLGPFIPPSELTPAIETGLAELFTDIPAFDFRLAKVARFPLVVYLAPEPADLFRALTEAVVDRFPGYPPYGGVFDEVIPHLTVAECETGMCEDPDAILGEIERDIVGVVPIEARAREVWLMEGNGTWRVRRRLHLGGER
jgi:hypothetical protein